MQPYFEKNQISNGSVFNVYLTNQNILRFKFYEWYTLLFFITRHKETCIMSESNYHNKNYCKLQLLEQELIKNDIHIGLEVPKTFVKCIKEVESGELISFSNEIAYACFDKQSDSLTLKRCCEMTRPDVNIFELYNKNKNYKLNPENTKAVYNFYTDLIKSGAVFSARKIDISTRPQEIINQYTNDLCEGKIRKFQLGPFKIRATRSVSSKKLVWYDDLGNQISATDVKIMIAWLNTTPIITDFIRKEETDDAVEDLYDAKVRAYIEKFYSLGRFKDAYRLISEYCKKQGENLNITLRTYNSTIKGFEAVGFSFSCKGDDVKVYKLQYENNDINNDVLSVSPAKVEDFERICASKKENYLEFVKDQVKETIKEQATEAELDTVAEIIAKHDIESGKAFDMLGEYNKGGSALADSYNEEVDRIAQFRTLSAEDRASEAIERYKQNAQAHQKNGQNKEAPNTDNRGEREIG